MTWGRIVAVTGVLAVVGLIVGIGGARWRVAADVVVPTASVVRGTLTLDMYLTGEFRARRSVPLTVPIAQNPLRLLSLAETGTAVRAGDIVMEFDPVDEIHARDQSRSELLEVEQEILKQQADADVQAAEAEADLLTARFDVRRAELETLGGNRFLGRIEAQRREIALDEARRRLAELEDALPSKSANNRAELAVLEAKRTQARLAATRAQQIIDSLVVRAPIDGVVVVRENRDMTFGYLGQTLPEYRVGDLAPRGRTVLEIIDVTELQIGARVTESERPNMSVGQSARVVVDGQAGEPLLGTVSAIAGMASNESFFFFGTGPAQSFDAVLTLDVPDERLRPGATAQIVVSGRELEDVLYVPPQAIFEREGQPTVYLRENDAFVPRTVTVVGNSAGQVAIEGVAEGNDVALVHPFSEDRPSSASTVPGADS